MDYLNFILIGFITVLVILSVWWAFNTMRQIEIQKNFCAQPLSSIAKLWRRAKFVPEDAKERESLYLYRDFLRKFDDSECKYPIMVKNGGVRAMSRKEYDQITSQKKILPFSPLILGATVLLAVIALIVNLAVTKTIWMGIGLALIMPVVQILLSLLVMRANREKDVYREAIFLALKENSISFLSVTKPFVIVDAYPEKFGKNSQPLYTVRGEITEEQINETREYITRQKAAESKVVLRNVAEMTPVQETKTTPVMTESDVAPETVVAPETEKQSETAEQPNEEAKDEKAEQTVDPDDPNRPLTREEKENLIYDLIDDSLSAEVNRAVKKAEQATEKPVEIEDLTPLPIVTKAADETPITVEAPAADDFSLDAIGQALDAEIVKRKQKK